MPVRTPLALRLICRAHPMELAVMPSADHERSVFRRERGAPFGDRINVMYVQRAAAFARKARESALSVLFENL